MSDGRTLWWAKDTAWHRRELIVELGEEHGSAALAVTDILSAAAKDQRAGGRVRHGFRSLAREAFCTADEVRAIMESAARIGWIDGYEPDPDGRRFRARIKGFKDDQDLATAAARMQAKRAAESSETPINSGEQNRTEPNRANKPNEASPTGQDITEQDIGVVSPVVVVGRARTEPPKTDYEHFVDRIVGVLQRGVDGLTSDEPAKAPTYFAVDAVLAKHMPWATPLIAEGVAIEVRSIVQSQNRAPNIVALFDQKLEQHRRAA